MSTFLTAFLFGPLWAEESAPSQPLRWMGHWKNEGLREQLVLEVLDDFTYLNQDIDVEFAFAADILTSKTQAAAAEFIADMIESDRITWDVVWMDPLIYKLVGKRLNDPLWGHKYLVDFTDVDGYAQTHKPLDALCNQDHPLTGGVFTGPYIEGFAYALWYNQEVAELLGLQIQESNMRFSDLLEYVKAVNSYNRTHNTSISAFISRQSYGSFSRLAYNLYLSEMQNQPATHQKTAICKTLKAFEELGKFYSSAWDSRPAAMEDWCANNGLFYIEPTWMYNLIEADRHQLLNKIQIVQLPGFAPQNYYVGAIIPAWAILKNSPNQDAGIRLMKFWSRPEIAEKWVQYTKCPTGLAGNLSNPEFGEDRFSRFLRRLCDKKTLQQPVFLTQNSGTVQKAFKYIIPLLKQEINLEDACRQIGVNTE